MNPTSDWISMTSDLHFWPWEIFSYYCIRQLPVTWKPLVNF